MHLAKLAFIFFLLFFSKNCFAGKNNAPKFKSNEASPSQETSEEETLRSLHQTVRSLSDSNTNFNLFSHPTDFLTFSYYSIEEIIQSIGPKFEPLPLFESPLPFLELADSTLCMLSSLFEEVDSTLFILYEACSRNQLDAVKLISHNLRKNVLSRMKTLRKMQPIINNSFLKFINDFLNLVAPINPPIFPSEIISSLRKAKTQLLLEYQQWVNITFYFYETFIFYSSVNRPISLEESQQWIDNFSNTVDTIKEILDTLTNNNQNLSLEEVQALQESIINFNDYFSKP